MFKALLPALLCLVFPWLGWAQGPACKVRGNPLVAPLTPEKLKTFLDRNKRIQDPSDLICCLPEEYRSRYVVVHSSHALQNGVPETPRVILFSTKANSVENFDMAITITDKVHGHNNVEMMMNEREKGVADLYDIDFDKSKHRLSEANPQKCLGCHSPNTKAVATTGVKPVFENAPWPSFVGGSRFLSSGSASQKYLQGVEKTALDAVSTLPRYACLKPQTMDQATDALVTFDGIAEAMTRRRIAKLIQETEDYRKFQPLIVGAHFGCLGSDVKVTKHGLDAFDSQISKWVPEGQLRQIFSSDRSLDPKMRTVTDFQAHSNEFVQRQIDGELAVRHGRSQMKDSTKESVLTYPSRSMAEFSNDNLAQIRTWRQAQSSHSPLLRNLNGYSDTAKLYARYIADTEYREEAGFGPTPMARFIFESRGISTLAWNRDMAGGYGTSSHNDISELLLASETDPYWKEILALIKASRNTSPDGGGDPNAKKVACERLQTRSVQNLGGSPQRLLTPKSGVE